MINRYHSSKTKKLLSNVKSQK